MEILKRKFSELEENNDEKDSSDDDKDNINKLLSDKSKNVEHLI